VVVWGPELWNLFSGEEDFVGGAGRGNKVSRKISVQRNCGIVREELCYGRFGEAPDAGVLWSMHAD
jgi:hypothetical protein